MYSITFLGTGGGRFVLLSQRRYTGGIWIDLGVNLILDPGPGALIRALQFKKNPKKLDAVLVSHKHLDHYNDAELMIEAMTYGLRNKKGILVVNKGVLEYISDYHKNAVDVIVPKSGDRFKVRDLEILTIPTKGHEEGVGFKFFSKKGTVTYASDTDFSPNLIGYYRDSKILILNVIFPDSKKIKQHLNTEKAIRIIDKSRPEMAIIQHFGMQMLNTNPDLEAGRIEEETGIKTIAARDGMRINIETLAYNNDKQTRLGSFNVY